MDATGNDSKRTLKLWDDYSWLSVPASATGDRNRNSSRKKVQLHPHAIHFRSVIKQISSLSNEDSQIHKRGL